MELVKLVMEIYYNLIRLQELEENNFTDKSENNASRRNETISNNSPPVAYYTTHSNNNEPRSKSRLLNSMQQHNDSIYMNNSCLNASFSENKEKKMPQKSSNDSNSNDSELKSAMKNMEKLNISNKEDISNDYINKLIDELNRTTNKKGILLF